MERRHSVESPDDIRITQLLRSLPLPEPDAEYEERMLREVLRPLRQDSRRKQRALSLRWSRWGWQLASVAGVFLVFLATASHWKVADPPAAKLPVAQFQSEVSRPLHILLESPRQMHGATIRVTLPDHVDIDGYRGAKTLQWQTDISAGGNRLYLPVRIRSGLAKGEILIEVEYQGARKRLRLPISPKAQKSPGETLTRT